MRRLFDSTILQSDDFIDMSLEARLLYFYLCLNADDDGLLGNSKMICRIIGVDKSYIEELAENGYIIPFTTGVIAITHWNVHNSIRKDRKKTTKFPQEKDYLMLSDNGNYDVLEPTDNQLSTNCQPNVRISKDKISKYKTINNNTNVLLYCSEQTSGSEPQEAENMIEVNFCLNDNTIFNLSIAEYEKMCVLYPNVDIMQELRNMSGWLESNPKKRKTKNGIMRFIHTWLRKEQDRNKSDTQTTQDKNTNSVINEWAQRGNIYT